MKSISVGTKKIAKVINKYTPEILTAVGIIGGVATAVMVSNAKPKAMTISENLKKEHEKENLEPPTKIEYVKATWRCYAPAITIGMVSACCLIGASSASRRRNAALATAYSLTDSAFKEYRSKVVETMGEKKDILVRDAIAKDKVDKNPAKNREVILTEKGNTLCYDSLSGRYFKSDIEQIKRVENFINKRLMNEMYVSLNDFYYELGLKAIALGDDIGWDISNETLEISFSSQLADDGTGYEGAPCLVLDYTIIPRFKG